MQPDPPARDPNELTGPAMATVLGLPFLGAGLALVNRAFSVRAVNPAAVVVGALFGLIGFAAWNARTKAADTRDMEAPRPSRGDSDRCATTLGLQRQPMKMTPSRYSEVSPS